ncbi:GIY-YIG nuclease family protein [Candidatus Microgenomates bacterium]|nr:GIY-YIG nuclease family protein [Candidatus Microgenomates bacterium]
MSPKYIVYILTNNIGKYYIGFSSDKNRRLIEHNRGQTRSTKYSSSWNTIYIEEFDTKKEAIKRERQIKSYKGGNAFRRLINKQ